MQSKSQRFIFVEKCKIHGNAAEKARTQDAGKMGPRASVGDRSKAAEERTSPKRQSGICRKGGLQRTNRRKITVRLEGKA